ncbi:hypothetical protein [uncultured Scardovia sp.]|uniref:hypothetical protein n=1 Tax=Scardovia wiggsiae TaxID=230143 RepID=UPI00374E8BC9
MKKLTALIMSLLMMFSLAACNSGETNTSVPSETESAEPESVQTSEPESTPSSEPENETAGGLRQQYAGRLLFHAGNNKSR